MERLPGSDPSGTSREAEDFGPGTAFRGNHAVPAPVMDAAAARHVTLASEKEDVARGKVGKGLKVV